MRFLLPLFVVGLAVGAFWFQAPTPGPTPEQKDIAKLATRLTSIESQLADLQAKADKTEGLSTGLRGDIDAVKKATAVRPFAEQFPEHAKQLAEHEFSIAKANETMLTLADRICKLEDNLLCPAEPPAKAPEKKSPLNRVELPLSAYDMALRAADATMRDVLFIISQNNCPFCDQLHDNVVSKPEFQDAIADKYVICEINISTDKDSASHFTVRATPGAVIYHHDTKTWQALPVIPRNIPAFLAILKGV